jgi:hypothetical protein
MGISNAIAHAEGEEALVGVCNARSHPRRCRAQRVSSVFQNDETVIDTRIDGNPLDLEDAILRFEYLGNADQYAVYLLFVACTSSLERWRMGIESLGTIRMFLQARVSADAEVLGRA